MYNIIVILTIFLATTTGQVVNPCNHNPGVLPQTTVVEGCNSSPCTLQMGRPLNIHVTFRAPRRLNNMVTLATSYFNLGNAILPSQHSLGGAANTCNNLANRRCPVAQGELVNFTLRLTVTSIPLSHTIPFEFRVVDHGPMLCFRVSMRGVSAALADLQSTVE